MNERLNLDESNGVSVLTEALTAKVEAILPDQSMIVGTSPAVKYKKK